MGFLPIPASVRVFEISDQTSREIKPGKDGYLGSDFTNKLRLEIRPKKGCGFVLKLTYPGKKDSLSDNSNQLALKGVVPRMVNGETVYVKDVPLNPAMGSDFSTTRWPKNHIKIISVLGPSADKLVLYVWEIGIITQFDVSKNKANFFLTTQLARKSRICKNIFGTVVLVDWPESARWTSLWNYLKFLITDQVVSSLPSIEDIPTEKTPPKLHGVGIVAWYNLASQLGLITINGKSVRIHWSNIKSRDRLKYLREGQKVRIAEIIPAINTHPHPRITNFAEDAIGVSPLSQKI